MDGLRIYANTKLGWDATRLENELKPVLKAMGGARQSTLVDWIQGAAGSYTSERLKHAADLIKQNNEKQKQKNVPRDKVSHVDLLKTKEADDDIITSTEAEGGHMSILFDDEI